MKKDMAMPGNQTTGLPAFGLTSPQPQLLGGLARELILHGPSEPYQPSDTRGPGSGLYTIDWVEISNQKMSETCMVLWHYNRILPL